MKVTLISTNLNTKYPQPPIQLLHLASYVRRENEAKVEVIDGNVEKLTNKELVRRIGPTDIIGVTGMTPHARRVQATIDIIRDKYEGGVPIVVGGPHMSVVPEECMRSPYIDVGVIGEGEQTLSDLIKFYEGTIKLDKVDGIIYRDKLGNLVRTNLRKHITNLDTLPLPAYDLIEQNLMKYHPYPPHGRDLPAMSMVTSRGAIADADTLVSTVDGEIPISEVVQQAIESSLSVYSKDGNSIITDVFVDERYETVIDIETEDDRNLVVTWDHPILTKRGWVEAKDLCEDDEVWVEQ